MSSKSWQKIFSVFLLAGLLLSLTVPGTAQAKLPAKELTTQAVQEDPLAKIEKQVLDEITANGNTDFFVTLKEQADLSAAEKLNSKLQKGEYVFNTLRATAERTQKDLRSYLDQQGAKYKPYYIANTILVTGGSQDLALAVASRSEVGSVTANHKYQLEEPIKSFGPEAPALVEPNLTFVNADDVWAMGITGAGLVLAGNDTGLSWTHPAIQPHYRGWNGSTADHNYNWWDATGAYPTVPNDGHGHGTHTTGTMVGDDGAGNQIGIAPGARTVHCKNMTDGGSGDDGTFLECFQWDLAPWDLSGANPDVSKAPDAVNNSWGYSGGGVVAFRTAINNLQAAGILVEVSAGNEGTLCATLRSPGDYQEVLTTGSVNHAGGVMPGTITGFSSRGPSDLDGNYFPDIMAPGENIRSSLPGGTYAYWGGTSMAGPHVTGLIGLLWSANPALRGLVETTVQMIKDTAVPLTGQMGSNCGGDYTLGPNNDWGYGTIDALAAVQLALAFGGSGTLQGTVTSSGTSAPLEGVDIVASLSPTQTFQSVTNAAGFYTMNVFSGTYTVDATTFGYLPGQANGVVVLADQTTIQDFSLAIAPSHVVSATVVDANTGWPLYAQVALGGTPWPPVWNDPVIGHFEVTLPDGAIYTLGVDAWAPGYVNQDVPVGPLTGDIEIVILLEVNEAACNAPGYRLEGGFFQNFEGAVPPALPGGWAEAVVTDPGTDPNWDSHLGTRFPSGYPAYSEPNLVYFNSFSSPIGAQARLYSVAGIDMTTFPSFTLDFWMFRDDGYGSPLRNDRVQVQVSTNGGVSWVNAGPEFPRYSATGDYWEMESVDLSAYSTETNLLLGFLATSEYGNDIHLDDISLGGAPVCVTPDGGLVVGNVYDNYTGASLTGALVQNDAGDSFTAVATTGDPAVDDAFYLLYSAAGSHLFTADFPLYSQGQATVDVVSGGTLEQNFNLLTSHLEYSPLSLEKTLTLGDSATDAPGLVISNTGVGDLSFELVERPGGFTPNILGGGPDPYGYTWLDSNEGGGPQYAWIDATGGTSLALSDDGEATITSPFAFSFYGVSSTSLRVGNNGAVLFNATTGEIVTTNSAMSSAPNNFISTFWDDIDADTGDVYWTVTGSAPDRKLVVEWFNRPHYSNIGSATFEVVLFENGDILFQYQDLNFGNASYDYGASATVGIRGGDATNLLQYSYNQAILQDNLAICFDNPDSASACGGGGTGSPIPWLAETPVTGTVASGSSVDIQIDWDASVPEVAQPGIYTGTLAIENNDPGSQDASVPVTLTVLPGGTLGKIAGVVSTDGYCGVNPAPLEGAAVNLEGSGGFTATVGTDVTGAYQYWLDSVESPYDVTVTQDGYAVGSAVVQITAGMTTTQNFTLTWLEPCATFDPPALSAALELGTSTTVTATLSNDGGAALNFELVERQGELLPLNAPSAGEDVLVVRHDSIAANAMQDALTALGFTFLGVTDAQFQAMTVDELLTYLAVFHAGTTGTGSTPGPSELLLLAYLDAGGSLYISDNDLGYWRDPSDFYNTYLQSTWISDDPGIYTLIGEDIMAGLNPGITLDPYPDDFNVGAEGVRIFQFTGGAAAGVAVDRNGYRAVYTSFDFQYIDSGADEVEVVNRVLQFLAATDVTWLSEVPITGTVAVGADQGIDVTFNASVPEVYTPGTYTADLLVKSNDPLNGRIAIPVEMVVTAPADWGELQGTIQTLGYCDSTPAPLEDATVTIASGDGYSFSTQTDAAGFYHIWADSDHNPLTVTVTADGQSAGLAEDVNIIPSGLVTVDFSLLWLEPCVSAAPATLEATVDLGANTTLTLTLANSGAAATDFTLQEQEGGYNPNKMVISIPASDGKFEHTPAVIGPAPKVDPSAARTSSAAAQIASLVGEPAFAVELQNDELVYIPDTSVPGTWDVIGTTSGVYYAGDFLNGDFTTLLVIDDNNNSLYAVDTATVAATLIGPSTPGTGQSWTGLAGATDGTLYGSATDCASSTLFTVDPSTGAATAVGPITNGACIIDIAINADGQLYGVDIIADTLVQIDTATGAGTVIGSVGINANYAQGLDFEEETGVLYWAAYSTYSELRVIDTATGNSTLVGFLPSGTEVDVLAFATGGASAEVPWLFEDPISGTLDAETGEVVVDVTMDASVVPQPGVYYAFLKIKTDDPVNGTLSVPVTMTVSPTVDYGILVGTVTSQGYCDAAPAPIEGAEVMIEASDYSTFTVLTDANGEYSRWLSVSGNPYIVSVTADGHEFGIEPGVEIISQGETQVDFGLRLLEPCVSAAPPALEVVVPLGYNQTAPLDILNDGAVGASFELFEVEGTPINPPVKTLAAEYNVLIVTPDSTGGDITLLLNTLALFPELIVTVWDNTAGNPTAADMAPYDVVLFGNDITWESEGLDKVAIGNAIADYIDAGGKGLEVEYVQSYDQWGFGGRYMTDGYSPFTPASLDNWDPDALVVEEPDHPVMAGVTTLNDNFGQQDPGLAVGAVLLATWNATGYNAVAANDNVVALNMNILQGADWTGDLGQLLYNAIAWLSGGSEAVDVPWLAEAPITGTVPHDSSFPVDVTFTAFPTMTVGGIYTASLSIVSNDPVYEEILVPVTMHVVEPVYGVEVSADQVGSGEPGSVVTYTVTITNTSNFAADSFTVALGAHAYTTTLSSDLVGPVPMGGTATFVVTVSIPLDALDGDYDTVQVTVTSVGDPTQTAITNLTTNVFVEEPPPPTALHVYLPLVWKAPAP